jgi:hypothetical protein
MRAGWWSGDSAGEEKRREERRGGGEEEEEGIKRGATGVSGKEVDGKRKRNGTVEEWTGNGPLFLSAAVDDSTCVRACVRGQLQIQIQVASPGRWAPHRAVSSVVVLLWRRAVTQAQMQSADETKRNGEAPRHGALRIRSCTCLLPRYPSIGDRCGRGVQRCLARPPDRPSDPIVPRAPRCCVRCSWGRRAVVTGRPAHCLPHHHPNVFFF